MVRGRAVGVLVACIGCSSPKIAFDDVDAAALSANCERLVRCGVFADQDSCEAFRPEVPDTSLVAAVNADTIHFDGVQAKQCMDALAALTCDASTRDARDQPAACGSMFTGTLADGDTCDFNRECSSDRCVPTAVCMPGACCPGTCQERAAVGDSCQVTTDCVANVYCGTDDVCHALGADGDNCFIDSNCDFGLGCMAQTLPGACRALPALGEPCPDARCADIGAVCDATATCVAAGLPGAPCTASSDCSSAASCDVANHVCAAFPTLGMPCTTQCAGESWCDTTQAPSTCVAPLANTTQCETNNQCTSQFCADGPVFDFCSDLPVCS